MATPTKSKKIKRVLRLQLAAGKATPAPPVGTALGPHGINIMEFCKAYNEKTRGETGILPAQITIYEDRSFSFEVRQPPVTNLLCLAAGVDKGSANPNRDFVGQVTGKQVNEIAERKMAELNAYTVEAAARIVAGTARSMGIRIIS